MSTDPTKGFLDDNATGDSYDPIGFPTIGDLCMGAVMDRPRQVSTQYGDRLLVNLNLTHHVENGQPQAIGPHTLWVKPGAMATALQDAIRKGGGSTLSQGDTLGMKYTGNGEAKQSGHNPPKQYAASHTVGATIELPPNGQPVTQAAPAAFPQQGQPQQPPQQQLQQQAPLTAPQADPFAGMG